eukprot:COSAG02_NODE_16969_length_1039_cov_1.863830_2_plen_156_part_00
MPIFLGSSAQSHSSALSSGTSASSESGAVDGASLARVEELLSGVTSLSLEEKKGSPEKKEPPEKKEKKKTPVKKKKSVPKGKGTGHCACDLKRMTRFETHLERLLRLTTGSWLLVPLFFSYPLPLVSVCVRVCVCVCVCVCEWFSSLRVCVVCCV